MEYQEISRAFQGEGFQRRLWESQRVSGGLGPLEELSGVPWQLPGVSEALHGVVEGFKG